MKSKKQKAESRNPSSPPSEGSGVGFRFLLFLLVISTFCFPNFCFSQQDLYKARLASPLNGNGKTITNLGTIRSTNYIDAATGLALATVGVTGTSGIISTTNGNVVSLSLYTAPAVDSFVNDINTVEIGSTVTAIDLDWVLSGGAITSQSINQGVGSLAIGLRTYNDTTDTLTNRTYTLTVSDGTTSVQASTSVTLLSKAYWGVSALTTLSDGQIIALSSEFATSRLRTKSVSPSNQYIYMVYPASFGAASFVVNGFTDTAWTLEGAAAQNFVNASGATVSYYVYRSNDTALGTFTVEVE